MTKNYVLPILFVFSIALFSCKSEKKQEKAPEAKPALKLTNENTAVSFTAYKTTDKIPVKGFFSQTSAELPADATSAEKALNGLKFDIPKAWIFPNACSSSKAL